MTHAVHTEPTPRLSDTARHWITAILTVIGIVVAAIGVWLEYGPSDATVNILGWTWAVADISELWAPWLMIAGGLLASISMGWETLRAQVEGSLWPVVFEGLILVAGITAVVVGVVLLF
jgi:hypothetical protein